MKTATSRKPKPETTNYVTLLSRKHEKLSKLLTDLRRIATLQLEAETARIWNTILEQKQILLNQIEAIDLEGLFRETSSILDTPQPQMAGVSSSRLGKLCEGNLELVREVAGIESAAEERLKAQLGELHSMIARARHTEKVSAVYAGKAAGTATPRFLDRRR